MTKISNQAVYKPDTDIVGKDSLIGSDSGQAKKTLNFRIEDIGSHFNYINGVRSFDYYFYQHQSANPKPADGYFYANDNEQNPENITHLYFSKITQRGKDVSQFFDSIATENPFDLQIAQKIGINSVLFFQIDNIEVFSQYYKLTVSEVFFPVGNGIEYILSYAIFNLKPIGNTTGNTDLSYNSSPTQGTVISSTGTNAVIPLVDVTNSGLMSPEEHQKLLVIEAGAEVNNISDTNATDLTDGGETNLHIHDDRYYTETEVDSLLNFKEDVSNKKTNLEANKTSNTFYASCKAIVDWVYNFFIPLAGIIVSGRKIKLNFLSTGLKISSRSDGSEIGVVLTTDNLTVDRTRAEQDKDGTYVVNSYIEQLFTDASNQEKTVNYIVSGDSTRTNGYNEMIDYYISQLEKVNISVYNNARSGAKGEDWLNNTDSYATLNNAIANTPSDGENTILEYSFGINDYTGNTLAEIKVIVKDGIQAYLTAKPKATVIMCVPIATANSTRNTDLFDIYTEVSNELGVQLIDTYNATLDVQGNTDYYADTTHPNKFGSRRIINYILNDILPLDLLSVLTLEEYPVNTVTPPATELSLGVEEGYYNNIGVPLVNASWRRFIEIDGVEPNFELIIEHQGNRFEAIFMDSVGSLVELKYTTAIIGETYKRLVTVPIGASKLRANISSIGAVVGMPSVKYNLAPSIYLTIEQINEGLDIRNNVYRPLPVQSVKLSHLDLNNTTSLTGTTANTEIFNYIIPSDTLPNLGIFNINSWFEKVGINGIFTVRCYLNSNIAPFSVSTGAVANRISTQLNKTIRIKDGNIIAKQGGWVDIEETVIPIVQSIDVTEENTIKVFVQLANGADSVKQTGFYLETKKIT